MRQAGPRGTGPRKSRPLTFLFLKGDFLMSRAAVWWSATAVLAAGVITPALARPQYLQAFKAHYNTAQGKPMLNAANCALCHVGPPPQAQWNPYGQAVRQALGARNVQDRAKIVAALEAAGKAENPRNQRPFAAAIERDRFPSGRPGGQNAGGARPGGGSLATVASNWEAVFNGVNTEGLTKMNAGNWEIREGILRYTGGGNGWMRSDKQYRNYSAVIVWRYPDASARNDSGIFLRAGLEGNPWPSNGGYQLNMGPGDNIGSISGTQGTRNRADLIKPNDWNTFQITVSNGRATLAINNQPAWEVATGIPDEPGYIGIENEGREIEVAQFWVVPLP